MSVLISSSMTHLRTRVYNLTRCDSICGTSMNLRDGKGGYVVIGRINTKVSLSDLATVTAIQTGRVLRPSVSPAICLRFHRNG